MFHLFLRELDDLNEILIGIIYFLIHNIKMYFTFPQIVEDSRF